MIEGNIDLFAAHPGVIRVTVSDREGLLIASARGPADKGSPDDAITDDLWNAYLAQFASNVSQHLRNVTLSRPLDMVVHGRNDSVLVAWLSVGWLIARVRADVDWSALAESVEVVRREFDELTGEPVRP